MIIPVFCNSCQNIILNIIKTSEIVNKSMGKVLDSQIKHLILYMKNVIEQGVDISALYIIQAYLTTLKSYLKPNSVLMQLFNEQQLCKMINLTHLYIKKMKQIGEEECKKRSGTQNLFLKKSSQYIEMNPMRDLSTLVYQIVQTLQQWEVITNKSNFFQLRLDREADVNGRHVQNLKEELGLQMSFVSVCSYEKESKFCESTECFSALSQSDQIPLVLGRVGEQEVVGLYEYLSRWSNEIIQEIDDFKQIIRMVKQQSSVDLQHERSISAYLDLQRRSSPPKKTYQNEHRAYLKQTKKTPFFRDSADQIQNKLQQNYNEKKLTKQKSMYSNISTNPGRLNNECRGDRKILSEMSLKSNACSKKIQKKDRFRQQSCQRCDIY